VTDYRGYTISLNPIGASNSFFSPSVMAHFPGGGITRLVISDPIVRDVINLEGQVVPGYWEIDSGNWRAASGSNYDQCSCARPTVSSPASQNVSTNWSLDSNGVDPNWSMLVQMTPNDGLVLRDVKLGQRYMVEKINVPYFYLETSALTKSRGE